MISLHHIPKIGRVLLFCFLSGTLHSRAQNADLINNYINTYKDLAIGEMQRTGVPAAITLAQGIHESGAGKGKLVLESNNHFGIKCKSNWTGETAKHDDDARGECFRKYPSAEDSYKDHSDFLKNSQRYASLFTLDPSDYQGWSNGLRKAGYATNPKYPQALIRLIEDYHLQDYTLIAMGKIPVDVLSNQTGSVTGAARSSLTNSPEKTEPLKTSETGARQVSYPDGRFRINETPVVYVKKGTSFLAIAEQYGLDLYRIFEFNELPLSEEVPTDQLIYLQRKRKTGLNKIHIVQPGESLHDIAQLEAIRLESLLDLNWLTEDMRPAIGEELSLQKKSITTPRLALKENYQLVPVLPNKNMH